MFIPARGDTIPVWTRRLYEVRSMEFHNRAVPVVIFFKRLSDSTSYCVYEVNDGPCQMTFVATQRNQKDFKRFKIGNVCDADFSVPQYTYTIYKHDSLNRTIRSIDHVQKAKDKYLIKDQKGEKFKQGYNLDNVETIKYSTTSTVTISRDGNMSIRTSSNR
ncbi:MAG TPA: hypothetical protein VFP87_12400 [Chitinophagaceae bacterium]|nr:hypothetical protein [Chitinophagaceae bacterium]